MFKRGNSFLDRRKGNEGSPDNPVTRLSFHRAHCVPQEGGRVQGWESECWGVLGSKFSFSKLSILKMSIIKLYFSKFQVSNVQCPNVHFSVQISNFISFVFKFPTFRLQSLNFQVSKFQIPKKTQTNRIEKLGTQTLFHKFQNFRFSDMKIIFARMFPYCFLYLLKYFDDKYGVRESEGPDLITFSVVPKMFQKIKQIWILGPRI